MSSDPEKADAPYNAAVILAAFFMEQKIAEAARAGHWDSVRIRVNGGLNGWQDFIACVNSLMHAIVEMSAAPVDVDGEISV
jgi:predicted chitinase